MASVNFTLDYEDVEKIQKAINNYENNAEDVINKYLHKEGKKELIDSIKNCMPVSNPRKGDEGHEHAKESNSLVGKNLNLGVKITTRPKFNYLIFPMEAIGTSKGKNKNPFMEKGVENVKDNIVNEILDKLGGLNI